MGPVHDTPAKGLVLVVEDEHPIADLVRLYLSRDGYGVHVEHDGSAGLAAARRLRPVACILDIALPGMDGTEICRRMRADGDWTPVIFLTARDDEVDRILGLELGGDDYVTKPSRRCCVAPPAPRTGCARSGRSRWTRRGAASPWTERR
jgi:two-component system OmpR family response regulator